MKENLKFKLDLLQAQLAKINGQEDKMSGTLFQTKFAILKKTEDADPEQISAEIEQTKQELASRRMHHAQVSLQRQLKTAKQVEALKIAKRLKNVQGDEKKVAALQEEANSLKEFTPADLANEIANRAVLKHFGQMTGFEKQKHTTAQANVYARLCKLSAVQQIVDNLIKGIAEWYNPLEGFGPRPAKEKVSAPKSEQQKAQSRKEPVQEPVQDDFHNFESDNEPEQAESESENELDDFFDQDIDIANTDSEDEGNLPALTQGYISGSEDDEPVAAVPERKNRRGQRARRKIWELKYGSRAKHVMKEQQEYEKKKQMKDARQQQRAAKQQQYKQQKQQKEEIKNKPLHPSWEAQKKQKEAQKAAQFMGKKITF